LLNALQHNIIWGQKGKFVDVPTDCPQRDERLGWTGDAQVFARTASFNHDTAAFYTKWLKDVALDQQDDGAVPFVIPNVLSHETRKGAAASAGWADVAVIVPWVVYQSYGDKRILERSEERRVGKECRGWGWREHGQKKISSRPESSTYDRSSMQLMD